jgi:hypothetical protein
MVKSIGILGVPAEDLRITDHPEWGTMSRTVYLPGITDALRKEIIPHLRQREVYAEDLGELELGEPYPLATIKNPKFLSYWGNYLKRENIRFLDVADGSFESNREKIQVLSKEYGLLVLIGPSHLGAIFLYGGGDVVCRMDYHADYSDQGLRTIPNYATYLNWVENNLKNIEVYNLFVCENKHLFGRSADSTILPQSTNHLDIDIDCLGGTDRLIDKKVYPETDGPAKATKREVLGIAGTLDIDKLGIWEYRPEYDPSLKGHCRGGLEFITNLIMAAAKGRG